MSNPAIMMYVPFALNGTKNTIQVTRQENQDAEDATLNGGFPDDTMIPKSNGGLAPKGQDFNGIFYLITLDTVHRQNGKRIQYDATYATNIGGYAKGSILQSTSLTKEYICTQDGNTTDPDSSTSKDWEIYAGNGSVPTATASTVGTVKIADTLSSTATDTALTANQGRILNEKKAELSASNTFTGKNTFNGGLFFGSVVANADSGTAPLGNGLKINWGVGNTDANGQLGALFKSPFSSIVLSYGATNGASKAPTSFCGIGQVDLYGMQVYAATSSGVASGAGQAFRWWAIGI